MYGTGAQASNRVAGLLAVLGGGITLVSCFLPSYLSVNPNATPPYAPSDYQVTSLWHTISSALASGTSFDYQTNTSGVVQPHIFVVVLTAAPIILAALILLLGVWAMVRRPGLGRSAVFSAAVVVLALYTLGTLTNGNVNTYDATFNAPLLALGSVVFLLGVFITLIASFLNWGSTKTS